MHDIDMAITELQRARQELVVVSGAEASSRRVALREASSRLSLVERFAAGVRAALGTKQAKYGPPVLILRTRAL